MCRSLPDTAKGDPPDDGTPELRSCGERARTGGCDSCSGGFGSKACIRVTAAGCSVLCK